MAKKKDKVFMPASWAGLMRFGEEEKEFIKLKPEYVIYACIGIIALEVLLRFFF
jgi:preprotein translocase subunit Sec61beta